MSALLALWRARSYQERRVLFTIAGCVMLAIAVALVMDIARIRAALEDRVSALIAQAETLEKHAAEIERLRTARRVPASGDMRSAIETETRGSGLGASLQRLDAKGADEAVVTMKAARFADWLAWIAALERQHIRVETSRIEALGTPGFVDATVTLVRGR